MGARAHSKRLAIVTSIFRGAWCAEIPHPPTHDHECEIGSWVHECMASSTSSKRCLDRVAIVGAGFGGLTCACALQQHDFSVDVFEQASSLECPTEGGEINLPSARRVFEALNLCSTWDSLRASSLSPRLHSVSKAAVKRALASNLRAGTVIFGTCVVSVEQQTDNSCSCTCTCASGQRRDYSLVIDAGGLLCAQLHAHAAIGDARASRSLSFMGWRRLKYGADDALCDGLDLGMRLSAQQRPHHLTRETLGRYECKRQRRKPSRPTEGRDLFRLAMAIASASVMAAIWTGDANGPLRPGRGPG